MFSALLDKVYELTILQEGFTKIPYKCNIKLTHDKLIVISAV